METGLVHIYSGEGKGKTTASVGLAVRALSHGLKVCYSYFNKAPSHYGNTEVNSLEKIGAVIFGNEDRHPSFNKNVTKEQHAKLTLKSFEELKELVNKQDFDIFYNQMPKVFLPTLVDILENHKPYFKKVYTELNYDKEISFEEFFIWWYHIIYSETTNKLIKDNIIVKPKNGLFYYKVQL